MRLVRQLQILAMVCSIALVLGGCSSGGGSSNSGGTGGTGSGGTGGTGGTGGNGQATAPGAATVGVAFSAKTLQFTWTAASGATSYHLMRNPDGASGFTQVGLDIPTTTSSVRVDIPVHLVNWPAARYAVDACNSIGCTRSNEVTVTSGMISAIGYIKGSNTEMLDQFGTGLAVSADGNTMAVGANEASNATGIGGNQANNSAINAGAVYVFTRDGNNVWSQQAYIKASNTGAQDLFGDAVSLSANGNTLVAGATGEDSNATGINGNQADNSATDSGAVYVFTRSGTAWTQEAYVKPSSLTGVGAFGSTVSVSNDGNTLAVGSTGKAYVFFRSGTIWSQQTMLAQTDAGDGFARVAISGDSNTLAIGASGEDSSSVGINGNEANNSAADSGAVYVYVRSAGVWSKEAFIKASNAQASDGFGAWVALSNDGNTLAASAPGEDSSAAGVGGNQADNSATDAGAAYVFTRSGTTWSQQAYVKASNAETGDVFGSAVALSGDGNTLAVGAYVEDSNATGIGGNGANNLALDSGAVYVFTRSGATWAQPTYVKASNISAGPVTCPPLTICFGQGNFGIKVALDNAGKFLAVGAIGESSNATGIGGDQSDRNGGANGAVYLY